MSELFRTQAYCGKCRGLRRIVKVLEKHKRHDGQGFDVHASLDCSHFTNVVMSERNLEACHA